VLTIYGASDDVVVVERDPNASGGAPGGPRDVAEVACFGCDVRVTVGWPDNRGEIRGVVVTLAFGADGSEVWGATVRQSGDGDPLPWPVRIENAPASGHPRHVYSVAAVVACPPNALVVAEVRGRSGWRRAPLEGVVAGATAGATAGAETR
jgi:hypothetical protein